MFVIQFKRINEPIVIRRLQDYSTCDDWSQVTDLDMYCCQLTKEQQAEILALPNLKALTMKNVTLSSDNDSRYDEWPIKKTKLETFAQCGRVDGYPDTLKELTIQTNEECRMTGSDLYKITRAARKGMLTTLSIHHSDAFDLLKGLNEFSLIKLDVRLCWRRDFHQLVRTLRTNTTITHITVMGKDATEEDKAFVSAALKRANYWLESVKFSNGSVTVNSEGAKMATRLVILLRELSVRPELVQILATLLF